MQITKLIADGVEETIQGLHILPVGMKVVVDGDEYEVVDVELMYANRIATVAVYLSLLSFKPPYGLVACTKALSA